MGNGGSFIIVGNKREFGLEVSTDEAIEKALEFEMIYTEVNAKTGEGVNELFEVIIRDQLGKNNYFE